MLFCLRLSTNLRIPNECDFLFRLCAQRFGVYEAETRSLGNGRQSFFSKSHLLRRSNNKKWNQPGPAVHNSLVATATPPPRREGGRNVWLQFRSSGACVRTHGVLRFDRIRKPGAPFTQHRWTGGTGGGREGGTGGRDGSEGGATDASASSLSIAWIFAKALK